MQTACSRTESEKSKTPSQGNLAAPQSPAPSAGIIGGQRASPKSFFAGKILYLATGVQITKDGNSSTGMSWTGVCTASAIAPDLILTAAHCVKDHKISQLAVTMAANADSSVLDLSQWYFVKSLQVHPNYMGLANDLFHDVAVLRLTQKLPDSKVLKLAAANQIKAPLSLVAVGYGTTSDSSDQEKIKAATSGLHYVLKTVEKYDPSDKVFSIDQRDHKGFCSGDSGGPGLLYDTHLKDFFIVGVVSFTGMTDVERNRIDPQQQFSLCIGNGNYTNLNNQDIRSWIDQQLTQH